MKFGYYYAIETKDREKVIEEITAALGKNKIIEILDILLYPNKESVDSLIWLPVRLKNRNIKQ